MPGDETNPKTRKPVEDGTGPELHLSGVAHFLRRCEPDQVRGFEAHLSATIAHPGRIGFYAYWIGAGPGVYEAILAMGNDSQREAQIIQLRNTKAAAEKAGLTPKFTSGNGQPGHLSEMTR